MKIETVIDLLNDMRADFSALGLAAEEEMALREAVEYLRQYADLMNS